MIPTCNHLTEEQLYDLLDQPTLATGAHACPACQQELASLRSSLANFRTAATNLAAAEMPPLATRRESPAPAPRFGFRSLALAASFATAAVLLVSSATLIHPRHAGPAIQAAPAAASSPDADAELLDGIQQDLSASVPPSLAPLEVAPTSNLAYRKN